MRGYAPYLGNTVDLERAFQDLMFGETFANGAVRVFDLNQEDAPANPAVFEPRGYFYRRFIDFARLIQTHRAALPDRDNAAEVALIYSLPTEWYESGGPFRFGKSQHQIRLQGWAKALDEPHVPHEMIVFGHPEFHPDRDDLLARLKRYRTAILPGERWRRPDPTAGRRAGLGDHDLTHATAVSDSHAPDFHESYRMKNSALWAFGGERQVLHTDASPATQFNLWLARNRRGASLHLVNYGVDLARDYLMLGELKLHGYAAMHLTRWWCAIVALLNYSTPVSMPTSAGPNKIRPPR